MTGSTDRILPPLSGIRVVSLFDDWTAYATHLLASLGATVVELRLPHDEPHNHMNRIRSAYGTRIAEELHLTSHNRNTLFQTSDVFLTSLPRRVLKELDLLPDTVRNQNRGVVYGWVRPFGHSAEWIDRRGSDLTVMAQSGLVAVSGSPDRPPVRISAPQAPQLAGAHLASGILLALRHRRITNLGETVMVSGQAASASALLMNFQRWKLHHLMPERHGSKVARGDVVYRAVWETQDGYISWRIQPGAGYGESTTRMALWLREDFGDEIREVDWESLDARDVNQADVDDWESYCATFFRRRTTLSIYKEAIARDIMIHPVHTLSDILNDEQLHVRGFVKQLSTPVQQLEIANPFYSCGFPIPD